MKFAFVLLTVVFSHPLLAQRDREFPTMSLHDISSASRDTIKVETRVKSIYTCPPCPPNARCKPCANAHVVLGEGDERWMVYTPTPRRFAVGRSYLFTLSLKNKHLREAVLIAADTIR